MCSSISAGKDTELFHFCQMILIHGQESDAYENCQSDFPTFWDLGCDVTEPQSVGIIIDFYSSPLWHDLCLKKLLVEYNRKHEKIERPLWEW